MPGVIPDLPPDQAVGTVYYVSPEQAEGKVLDHRSDLYSLGIMMYQMSSGKLPFQSNDIDRVARMQASAPPKRPRLINPEISKGLEQIILKAIAKKPYMRFNSADEMRRYLEILKRNPSSVFRLQSKSSSKDPDRRPDRYHINSAHAVLIGICAAFIIVASIAAPIIYNRVLKGTNGDSIILSVPDVLGAKYTNVSDSIDERYYDIDVIYVYNSKSAPGVVVSQSPAPHERVEINPFEEQCVITISVSAEVRELTVIDVISLSPEEASTALRREGYSVNFLTVYSDTVAKGLVCGTFPAAGEKVLGGSEITIYVSMGSEVLDIKVPSFVGLSESEAATKLKTCGLTIGKITYKASSEAIGTVIHQSLNVDQSVPKGTAIDLVISGGPNFIS
jgi:serine/threonine-protein kinase